MDPSAAQSQPAPPKMPKPKAITWMIRLVFCLFMVVAYLGASSQAGHESLKPIRDAK